MVLAPVVRAARASTASSSTSSGPRLRRVRVDGEVRRLEEAVELDKKYKHDIAVVVDRLVMRPDARKRLADSIEAAVALAEGIIEVEVLDADGGTAEVRTFSERFACLHCGTSMPELEPRMFSFNSPHGACARCTGLGSQMEIDPDLVVPDPSLTLAEGADPAVVHQRVELLRPDDRGDRGALRGGPGHALGGPAGGGAALLPMARAVTASTSPTRTATGAAGRTPPPSRGSCPTSSGATGDGLGVLRGEDRGVHVGGAVPGLQGRAFARSLAVKVGGLGIHEATRMSARRSIEWFQSLDISDTERQIARLVLREILERLQFLDNVGVGYLSMDRAAATLSGGEAQRIRLATQIGSSLVGVLYILDEPSIGLHQRDNAGLIATLQRLRDLGNTVIVVEHDEGTMRAADHLLDLGPGAGEHGGEIVAQGTPEQVMAVPESLTGQFLSGVREIRSRRSGAARRATSRSRRRRSTISRT